MRCISRRLKLLHCLFALALCTWTSLLESWRSAGRADAVKCCWKFDLESIAELFNRMDTAKDLFVLIVECMLLIGKNGNWAQLAEKPLILIFLNGMGVRATSPRSDEFLTACLSLLKLYQTLGNICPGMTACNRFPTLGSVWVSARTDTDQSLFARPQN